LPGRSNLRTGCRSLHVSRGERGPARSSSSRHA
jgi:hypothetical protein